LIKFSRRKVVNTGVAAAGAALASKVIASPDQGSGGKGSAGGGSGAALVSSSGLKSPSVAPWVEPLYIPPVLTPAAALAPAFQPDEPARDWWKPYTHQRYAEFPAHKFYQLNVQNANWSFHRSLPPTPLFTYNGNFPGPMIHARYGEPIVVRINNELQPVHTGLGIPDTATHLHNMHAAAESDGYPGDFVTPGNYRDQHYPMVRAGYDQYRSTSPNGDYRESLGSMWYHDHRINYTSQNAYKGM